MNNCNCLYCEKRLIKDQPEIPVIPPVKRGLSFSRRIARFALKFTGNCLHVTAIFVLVCFGVSKMMPPQTPVKISVCSKPAPSRSVDGPIERGV